MKEDKRVCNENMSITTAFGLLLCWQQYFKDFYVSFHIILCISVLKHISHCFGFALMMYLQDVSLAVYMYLPHICKCTYLRTYTYSIIPLQIYHKLLIYSCIDRNIYSFIIVNIFIIYVILHVFIFYGINSQKYNSNRKCS